MVSEYLELVNMRHNTDEQCVACVLHTIIKNQFHYEKAVNSNISYSKIKKWINYNIDIPQKRIARLEGVYSKICKEMFHGIYGFDFHVDLNPHLKSYNIKLMKIVDFDISIIIKFTNRIFHNKCKLLIIIDISKSILGPPNNLKNGIYYAGILLCI